MLHLKCLKILCACIMLIWSHIKNIWKSHICFHYMSNAQKPRIATVYMITCDAVFTWWTACAHEWITCFHVLCLIFHTTHNVWKSHMCEFTTPLYPYVKKIIKIHFTWDQCMCFSIRDFFEPFLSIISYCWRRILFNQASSSDSFLQPHKTRMQCSNKIFLNLNY